MAWNSNYRILVTTILLVVAGIFLAGTIGFVTTKLVLPDQLAAASASEKAVMQRTLVLAKRCLDNPILRRPIVQYRISVSSVSLEPNPSLDTDAPAKPSIRPVNGQEMSPIGEVVAYTLFAIPLYKISVGNPGVCKVL